MADEDPKWSEEGVNSKLGKAERDAQRHYADLQKEIREFAHKRFRMPGDGTPGGGAIDPELAGVSESEYQKRAARALQAEWAKAASKESS